MYTKGWGLLYNIKVARSEYHYFDTNGRSLCQRWWKGNDIQTVEEIQESLQERACTDCASFRIWKQNRRGVIL